MWPGFTIFVKHLMFHTKLKTMQQSVQELKNQFAKTLASLAAKLTPQQKMETAVNLKIALATFNRYTSGDVKEIRRVELAESIINEIQTIPGIKKEVAAHA